MGKKRGRPPAGDAKKGIYSRIAPETIEALDRICETMRPRPTRAQLIDLACAEFVERHKSDTDGRKGSR